MSAELFLMGMKAKWDEGSGRILLGDNKDYGEVVPRPIRFQCTGVWISTGLPVYTYKVYQMYSQLRLSPDLPELVRTSGCVRIGIANLSSDYLETLFQQYNLYSQKIWENSYVLWVGTLTDKEATSAPERYHRLYIRI